MEIKINPPEDNPLKYEGLNWQTCDDNTIFTDKNGKIRLIEYWNGVDEYYNENEVLYNVTGDRDAIREVEEFKKQNTLLQMDMNNPSNKKFLV